MSKSLDPRRASAEASAQQLLAAEAEGATDADLTDKPLARAQRALALRVSGATYRQIAQQLGYDGPSGAYYAVSQELRRRVQEPADELRELELLRLDRVNVALFKIITARGAEAPEVVPAVNAFVRLSKRRAELLGLDAPRKIDITARVRMLAVEAGLDPDQAVNDAREALRALAETAPEAYDALMV